MTRRPQSGYGLVVDGLVIRPLQAADLTNGFLQALDALQPASDLEPAVAQAVFRRLDGNPDCVVAVAELGGRVAGAATLWIEHKFIHRGGRAGHIEDVAVATHRQGQGIGRALVDYLLQRAAAAGCYKTMLYCDDRLLPFYQKLGFHRRNAALRFDHLDHSITTDRA